jgi:hypothetical protein
MASKKKGKRARPEAVEIAAPIPSGDPSWPVVDALLGGVADLGAACFRLNGHGGLTYEQQSDFYQKGVFAQALLEDLRQRYASLSDYAATGSGRIEIGVVHASLGEAVAACGLVAATQRPQRHQIATASERTAGALDRVDVLRDKVPRR